MIQLLTTTKSFLKKLTLSCQKYNLLKIFFYTAICGITFDILTTYIALTKWPFFITEGNLVAACVFKVKGLAYGLALESSLWFVFACLLRFSTLPLLLRVGLLLEITFFRIGAVINNFYIMGSIISGGS